MWRQSWRLKGAFRWGQIIGVRFVVQCALMLPLADALAIVFVEPFILLLWRLILGYLVLDDLPNQLTGAGIAVIVASGLCIIERERVAHLAASAP